MDQHRSTHELHMEGIGAVGVLEPIVVRPVLGTDLFEIIAGERRWRAARNVFGDDYDMPVSTPVEISPLWPE